MPDIPGSAAPAQGYANSGLITGDTTVKSTPGFVHSVLISPILSAGEPTAYTVQLVDGVTTVMEWNFAATAATSEAANLSHCAILDTLLETNIKIAFGGGTSANVCVTYL